MIESASASWSFPARCLAMLALVVATSPARPAGPPPAAAASAGSATPVALADERARIAQERNAVDARFSSRERECRQRFIVTSCVDDAKAERRLALDRLRARQLAVDEARRHERADERRAELADKAAEDARRESARAAHAAASAASSAAPPSGRPFEARRPEAATSATSGGRDGPRPSTGVVGGTPPRRESKATREQREAAHRAAFEARKAQALEHRDEAIERTTKRMAQKAPASPLPVPPAASAATSSTHP